ncbi:hypothetical protein [Geomonas agri]|uniref:hypothetical protein n=1 Tax=Geomonas agri TaxID=2873702 RepID=UPI001CD2CDB5|nr:hypothetical protein [Geomonas agri]
MLNINKAKLKLTGQGADPVHLGDCIRALQAENLLPADNNSPINAKDCAVLLIGCTSLDPANAAQHVLVYGGLQGELGLFGISLQYILGAEPSRIAVTSVRICQDFPLARIEYADSDLQEFTAVSFIGKGLRQEVVVSGGLIASLAMGLKHDTVAGWRGAEFQKQLEEVCNGQQKEHQEPV